LMVTGGLWNATASEKKKKKEMKKKNRNGMGFSTGIQYAHT